MSENAPRFKKTVIKEKNQLSSHFYHIKVYGEEIKEIDYIPGQHIKAYVGSGNPEELPKEAISGYFKSYSLWNYNKDESTIDLAINTLSNGPGANWIKNVQVNDQMFFFGPKSSFILDNDYQNYYFIGDITSLAHLYAISRELPKDKNMQSVIYADSKDKFFLDLDKTNIFNFKEITDNNVEKIIQEINLLSFNPDQKNIVYIAGEAQTCFALNQYFIEKLNWNKEDIRLKKFWTSRKAEN